MVQRLFSLDWQLAMSYLAGVVGASIMPGLLRRTRSKLLSGSGERLAFLQAQEKLSNAMAVLVRCVAPQ